MVSRRLVAAVIWAWLTIGMLAASAIGAPQPRPAGGVPTEPDRKVQRRLDVLSSLFLEAGRERGKSPERERKVRNVVSDLTAMRDKGKNIVLELLLYGRRVALSDPTDEQRGAASRVWVTVVSGLYADGEKPHREALARGIAPVIKTEDPAIKAGIESVLRIVCWDDMRRDYGPLVPLIEGHKDDPPRVLVEYMYRGDAIEAFRTMIGVYAAQGESRQELMKHLQAVEADDFLRNRRAGRPEPDEQTKALALKTLEELAGRDEWWARLFAKAELSTDPAYRRTRLAGRVRERLDEDERPVVKDMFRRPRGRDGRGGRSDGEFRGSPYRVWGSGDIIHIFSAALALQARLGSVTRPAYAVPGKGARAGQRLHHQGTRDTKDIKDGLPTGLVP